MLIIFFLLIITLFLFRLLGSKFRAAVLSLSGVVLVILACSILNDMSAKNGHVSVSASEFLLDNHNHPVSHERTTAIVYLITGILFFLAGVATITLRTYLRSLKKSDDD